MLNKILYNTTAFISLLFTVTTNAKQWASHQSGMLPVWSEGVTTDLLAWQEWEDQVDKVSGWLVESIEWLLPLVAIWVFLFVGIKLAIAKWNPEEFKKAWMQFVYAIIGIFAVSFAWVTVKLVAGLSF
jgi:hypothetical protein